MFPGKRQRDRPATGPEFGPSRQAAHFEGVLAMPTGREKKKNTADHR